MVLIFFLLAFVAVRTLVYMMMSGRVHNVFFHLHGTHLHHLNFGIFILAGIAGYLLFWHPSFGVPFDIAAAGYGVGMALTFDEFGMWLHLDDNYWQRASWDAMGVIASVFGLIAFAPDIGQFALRHWIIVGALAVVLLVYFFVFVKTIKLRRLAKT